MTKYTDHHSRLTAVYFVDKKSDTLYTLGRLIQDLAISLGLIVQHLCSDNGGDYTSSSFQEYCKSAGIRQQFSAPYTLPPHPSPEDQLLHDDVHRPKRPTH